MQLIFKRIFQFVSCMHICVRSPEGSGVVGSLQHGQICVLNYLFYINRYVPLFTYPILYSLICICHLHRVWLSLVCIFIIMKVHILL